MKIPKANISFNMYVVVCSLPSFIVLVYRLDKARLKYREVVTVPSNEAFVCGFQTVGGRGNWFVWSAVICA